MEFYSDFKEFIRLLKFYDVKYLIVGGYALSFYSRPKNTFDIDIFIEATETNAHKMVNVLSDFGFDALDISVGDLSSEGQIIQLGISPIRIDILTGIEGIKFKEAYNKRVKSPYGDIDVVNFISLEDLIKNKKASGRKKDMNDIDWLNRYKNKK